MAINMPEDKTITKKVHPSDQPVQPPRCNQGLDRQLTQKGGAWKEN
jgi:hypothetical protein